MRWRDGEISITSERIRRFWSYFLFCFYFVVCVSDQHHITPVLVFMTANIDCKTSLMYFDNRELKVSLLALTFQNIQTMVDDHLFQHH